MNFMCFLILVVLTESVRMQNETTLKNNKKLLKNQNGISYATKTNKLPFLVLLPHPSIVFLSRESKKLNRNARRLHDSKEKLLLQLPFVTIIDMISPLWKKNEISLTPNILSKQSHLKLKQNNASFTPVMLESPNTFKNDLIETNNLVNLNYKVPNPARALNTHNLLRVHQSFKNKETNTVKGSFSEAFKEVTEFTELVDVFALDNNEYFSINLPISYTGLNKSKKHSVNPVLLKEKTVTPSLSTFSITSFAKIFSRLAHKVATIVF
ncbi:uncharacterized protein LOC128884328 isoform X2 [Hylaeus volcanicus]|uniref:uncharacterized protein LOC128884328 isoform X2 n=1 Tax=Hylaeus volcanicus TaxID=313075 RepID=UPI0023B81172|nr:uncharacterized protein LOC128884328 isoform X2 [Hylaeus volcanicus]